MHTAVPSHGRAPGGCARPPDQLLIQTALSYQAVPAGGLTHTTRESFDLELVHILTLIISVQPPPTPGSCMSVGLSHLTLVYGNIREKKIFFHNVILLRFFYDASVSLFIILQGPAE